MLSHSKFHLGVAKLPYQSQGKSTCTLQPDRIIGDTVQLKFFFPLKRNISIIDGLCNIKKKTRPSYHSTILPCFQYLVFAKRKHMGIYKKWVRIKMRIMSSREEETNPLKHGCSSELFDSF